MSQPWIYMCSLPWFPLPPPFPSHPSGSSQCISPEHLSHASNLGWWSVSPLIVYLFQCYSLRTSHSLLLPQSPKVFSVHLCLFFCFAYWVIITKIDAFELWCWRRLLSIPWTARRTNQSIVKEISPWCSLEGLMLKLKLQYFGHLMQKGLIGKDPDSGRDWGQEEKGTPEDEMAGWHHRLNGHEFE